MKTYGSMKIENYTFLTSGLDSGECLALRLFASWEILLIIVITGFRCGVNESFALLGYYAAYIGSY